MKLCKHYFVFLLAGALLLLPVTSQYALDINWWKEKISQYQETLQKTMPGALVALGAAGALYYWWSKRGGDGGGGKKIEPFVEEPKVTLIPQQLLEQQQVPLKVVAPSLQQLQVYSHFNDDGQGVESTGYHTLLRAMQVVQVKNDNESDEDLQEELQKPDLIEKYFGDDGIWRQAIMQRSGLEDIDKGNWLDDEELLFLWKNYRSDFIPDNIECYFFTIPNFSRLGNELSVLELYIKNKVQPVLHEKGQFFIIFALGAVDTIKEKERIEIRWYPLVMYQDKEGKRKYYIMDSYDNIDRTKRENIQKLIDLIEKAAK
jgi:hypothetical protein